MRFAKTQLAPAEQGYSVASLTILGEQRVVAAPEGPGPTMAFSLPSLERRVLADGPGGCMGFAPYRGRDDAILMITRFLPVFQAEGAGLDLYHAVDGLERPWQGRRVLDLPFIHRFCAVGNGQTDYLVAATICGGKASRDDWSQAGAVYAVEVPTDPQGAWKATPVLESIHRNHGMYTGRIGDRSGVFVSGDEGLFALKVPAPGASEWQVHQLIDRPISEFAPIDIDGDGEDEIAVIEPFHGPAMTVYKQRSGRWEPIFSEELAFGHGLWAGMFAGTPAVIASNRDGDKDLVCWRVTSTDPLELEGQVVDAAAGAAGITVIEHAGREAIVAANLEHEEYAIYRVIDEVGNE